MGIARFQIISNIVMQQGAMPSGSRHHAPAVTGTVDEPPNRRYEMAAKKKATKKATKKKAAKKK
jgi:hypothetical protein